MCTHLCYSIMYLTGLLYCISYRLDVLYILQVRCTLYRLDVLCTIQVSYTDIIHWEICVLLIRSILMDQNFVLLWEKCTQLCAYNSLLFCFFCLYPPWLCGCNPHVEEESCAKTSVYTVKNNFPKKLIMKYNTLKLTWPNIHGLYDTPQH